MQKKWFGPKPKGGVPEPGTVALKDDPFVKAFIELARLLGELVWSFVKLVWIALSTRHNVPVGSVFVAGVLVTLWFAYTHPLPAIPSWGLADPRLQPEQQISFSLPESGVAVAQAAEVPTSLGVNEAVYQITSSAVNGGSTTTGTEQEVFGVDVSEYQGDVDWAKMAQEGVQFAWIRTGSGIHSDPTYADNAAGAASAEILWGPYHHWRPGTGPEQAQILINAIQNGPQPTLRPAVDIEETGNASAVMAYADYIETSLGGVTPVIYTSASAWASLNQEGVEDFTGWAARHPGWVAEYTDDTRQMPTLPLPWQDQVYVHQFSRSLSGPRFGAMSTDLDGDNYLGSLASFLATYGWPKQ